MIAGLPVGTWILMALATLLGLVLVLVNYRIHSRAEPQDTGHRRGQGDDS